MTAEETVNGVVDGARALAQSNPATAAAFALVEHFVRAAVAKHVDSVTVTAPGVVIDDARTPGKGAVVEDVRE